MKDPSRPRIIAEFQYNDNPGARDFAIAGSIAAVLDKNRLWLVDLSDPRSPRARGNIDIGKPGHCNRPGKALDAQGNLVYVANNARLSVFDISNPDKPVLRGRTDFVTGGRFTCSGMDVKGKYAYVADYWYGVHIIDISNPDMPKKVPGAPAAGEIRDVYAWSGNVAVAHYNGGVFFIDASEPARPLISRHFYLGQIVRSVTGDYQGMVYAIEGCGGVFDARDIQNVKRLSGLRGALGIAYANGIVYSSGITRSDVANPKEVKPLGPVETGVYCWGIAADGKFLYVNGVAGRGKKNERKGIFIYDISDPARPGKLVATIPASVPTGRSYLFVRKGLLCVPYWNPRGCSDPTYNRVEFYDVTDPAHPRLLHTIYRYDGTWGPHKVYLEGNYLYLADYTDGIKIFDVSDIKSPRLIAHHIGGYRMNFSFDIDGDHLYRGRLGALEILDVPRPSEAPRGKVTVHIPVAPLK